jgi:3-keto-5-aminohexanoate cleavage enzyme
MSVVVTVAPTGLIATKADNPNLPTQPAEIAAAVEAGYHLGASVAHIHLRDEDDQPAADLGIAAEPPAFPSPGKPVTNQVTTPPGIARRSATRSDTDICLACGNRT